MRTDARAGVPDHGEYCRRSNDKTRVRTIEACEHRDLSRGRTQPGVGGDSAAGGVWADELLRVDVGDAVRFTAIDVDNQRARGALVHGRWYTTIRTM